MAVDGITTNANKTQTINSTGVNAVSRNTTTGSKGNLRVDAGNGGLPSIGGGTSGPQLQAPSQVTGSELMVMLYTLQTKSNASRMKTAQGRIGEHQQVNTDKHTDIIKQIQKKMANNSKVGDIFAKIFGWVGVLLTFIVAIVVGVVSGGVAAAPLIAAGIATAAVMILQQSGAMSKMMEGLSSNAKIGVSAGLAALMLVMNIVATVASGGIAAGSLASGAATVAGEASTTAAELVTDAAAEGSAAAGEISTEAAETSINAGIEIADNAAGITEDVADAGETVTETAQTATNTAETATESTESVTQELRAVGKTAAKSAKVLKIAEKVRSAALLGSSTVSVLGGATQASNAGMAYQTAEATAQTKRDKADILKQLAMSQEDAKRLRKIMEQMEGGAKLTIQGVEEAHDTSMRISKA